MKYTTKEIFDECSEAALECPQARPEMYQYNSGTYADYELDIYTSKTWLDLIKENDVTAIALAFSNDPILTKSGYHTFVEDDMWKFIMRTRISMLMEKYK
jgi:hypothetical protein